MGAPELQNNCLLSRQRTFCGLLIDLQVKHMPHAIGLVNLQDKMLVDGQHRAGESAGQVAREFDIHHCFIVRYFHIRQETGCMVKRFSGPI